MIELIIAQQKVSNAFKRRKFAKCSQPGYAIALQECEIPNAMQIPE
jgi:hypothetical protein